MHRIVSAAAFGGALCVASATAFPHALLRTATPAAGSTLPTAPPAVTLTYSEGVEPKLSTITVTDAKGARVDKADVHLDGDAKHLAVGLPALPAGDYKVVWHATSVDTHKTEGSFTFTVAP